MLVQGGGGLLLVSISSKVFNNSKQRMIINNDINWMMIICCLLFPKWMMTYTAVPINLIVSSTEKDTRFGLMMWWDTFNFHGGSCVGLSWLVSIN